MRALLLPLMIFCPSWALAQESGAPDIFPAVLKMVGALLLVLGLVFFLYAMSRRGFGSLLPGARSGQIRVVETRYLGPKKAVCLIEVRGQEFLLGVGSERVDLLSALGPKTPTPFEETLKSSEGERQ